MTSTTRIARAAARSRDLGGSPRGSSHFERRGGLYIARRVGAAVAAVFVVAGTLGVASSPAAAQQSDEQVRISARKVADGRVEFALQQRQADNSWGDRQLPRQRFFPTTATVGRWLNSTPLTVGDTTVRITARKVADGRIEFALQQRQADNSWGQRLLPSKRFFPTTATVGRWLNSSPLNLKASPVSQQQGYSAIAVGYGHSCGLRNDGTVTCWGENFAGQADAPGGQFRAIAAGGGVLYSPVGSTEVSGHSCGLRNDGTVTCWGKNSAGETDVPGGEFSAIAAGGSFSQTLEVNGVTRSYGHSCGLRRDGTVTCWGRYGVDVRADVFYSEFTTVAAGDVPDGRFSAIAAGLNHSCGLRNDGAVTCWGDNWYGQTDVPDGRFTAIAAGYLHNCGLRSDGAVTCWGDNEHGQTDVSSGRFSAIAAGLNHSCGLRSDGTVTCWGGNDVRQGDVPDGRFTAIAAGATVESADLSGAYLVGHTCGLRTDGTITCWGGNPYDPSPIHIAAD